MGENMIEIKKMSGWRRYVLWAAPILLVLAICLSLCKGCTALYPISNVYDPQENGAGFINKAELVFQSLLSPECVDTTIEAISLDALNKRYKAFDFALPFGEENNGVIESSNLRLVGIHPEYIKDEELRRFYYNSRLPQLLEQQAEHLGERFFNIYCKRDTISTKTGIKGDNPQRAIPVSIESITMIPSMFKVRLTKTPWTGVIEGKQNCIFDQDSTIYLTFGNSVLPIHNDTVASDKNIVYFNAIMNEGLLLWTPSGERQPKLDSIDYYRYYKTAFDCNGQPHAACIWLHDTRHSDKRAHITISYSKGKLTLLHDCGLLIVSDKNSREIPELTKAERTEVDFEDGMKVIMYTVANHKLSEKLGEITLFKENPMRMMSFLTQSSVGVDRFFISDYQTDLFTQQLLHGLSQHLSNRENVDTVRLTIDPLLSREFEKEIKEYVSHLPDSIKVERHDGHKVVSKPASQVNELYDMSVTIMDMATGEVLASPFYTTLFESGDFPDLLKLTTRNTSLSRRSVGSTFKPMEALASVLSVPSLLDMNTANPSRYGPPDFKSKSVRFFGRPTEPWAEKSPEFWGGCDFTSFLSKSDDVYPVGLVALALSDNTVNAGTTLLPIDGTESYFTCSDRNGRPSKLRFKKMNNRPSDSQPFINNMAALYNVNRIEKSYDPLYKRTADLNLFERLIQDMNDEDDRVYGLQEVSPEPTQLHFERFERGEDFHDLLTPWVLGQGDNMWNCVKLAEAWARMISKRDVRATFIHHPENANCPSLINDKTLGSFAVAPDYNATWNRFLVKFRAAQNQGGLLSPMKKEVDKLGKGLVLFSKTGTPDAYNPPIDIPLLGGRIRKMDIGLYCFVLTKEETYQNYILMNKPSKGIVCVVRVARTYECHECKPGSPCKPCDAYWGLQSKHARNFFAKKPALLRKLYDMTENYY